MKFNRAALVEMLDDAERHARDKAETAHAERVARHADALAEWQTKYAPELATNLQGLAKRARAGRVVTRDDVYRAAGLEYDQHSLVASPNTERRVPAFMYTPDAARARLRRLLLDVVTEDEVTSSSLRDLGYNPSAFVRALSR